MSLPKVLLASVGSRLIVAASGLIGLPIYLHQLGADDFGVIGFFLSLQTMVSFLDLGLGATLVRQLSGQKTSAPNSSYRIAQSFELIYLLVACVAGLFLVINTAWLTQHWLNSTAAQMATIKFNLQLAIVGIFLHWHSSIYNFILTGLEKQIDMAIQQGFWALMRLLIPVAAILWQPNLKTFFTAYLIVTLLQVITMRWAAYRHLESDASGLPKIDFSMLKADKAFTGGMLGIVVTAFCITQLDKIILSKTLSLADFGRYTLCASLASGIYLAVQPLFNIIYPRFTQLINAKQDAELQRMYRLSSQVMALLVIPISSILMVFPFTVLYVWTGDVDVAEKSQWVLRALVLANMLNAILNLPYALQLAAGWSSLAFRVNLVSIAFLLPAMILFVQHWGGIAAAACLAGTQLLTYLVVPHLSFKKLLADEKWAWYRLAFLRPALLSITLLLSIQSFWVSSQHRLIDFMILGGVFVLTAGLVAWTTPALRESLVVRFARKNKIQNQ